MFIVNKYQLYLIELIRQFLEQNRYKHIMILAPNELSTHEARFIFHLRSRMVDLKANFRGKHSDWLCPLCKCDEDSQQHLLVCPELNEEDELVLNVPNYDDLFSENLEDKSNISRILRKRFLSRNILSKT